LKKQDIFRKELRMKGKIHEYCLILFQQQTISLIDFSKEESKPKKRKSILNTNYTRIILNQFHLIPGQSTPKNDTFSIVRK
jgi:hypothetical protein